MNRRGHAVENENDDGEDALGRITKLVLTMLRRAGSSTH